MGTLYQLFCLFLLQWKLNQTSRGKNAVLNIKMMLLAQNQHWFKKKYYIFQHRYIMIILHDKHIIVENNLNAFFLQSSKVPKMQKYKSCQTHNNNQKKLTKTLYSLCGLFVPHAIQNTTKFENPTDIFFYQTLLLPKKAQHSSLTSQKIV